jgi:hypothetical protein
MLENFLNEAEAMTCKTMNLFSKQTYDNLGKRILSISDNWIGNLKVKKLATLMKSKLL